MITIRRAAADDAAVLTGMVRASAAYRDQYFRAVRDLILDEVYLDTNPVYVAQDGEYGIVGFYSLLVPGRGGPAEAELDFMFVDNEHQRRHIGRELIGHLERYARERGLCRVHIVAHPPAEPFYRAIGARQVGIVPPSKRVTWSRPWLVLDIR